MPNITLTDPVAGTVVASGLIATNNSNLRTLLNSGLDPVNLKGNPALVSGETAVWNGASFDRSTVTRLGYGSLPVGVPKVTTSALSGGPPGSPGDGDIWIATGVDANGARWAFQYNSGSGSSFKWEFIGGSELTADVASNQTTSSTTNVDLTTAQAITLLRAGDYRVKWGAEAFAGTAVATLAATITKAGVEQAAANYTATAVNSSSELYRAITLTGLAANDVLKEQYRVSNGSAVGNFGNRAFSVLPIRVS